MKSTVTTVNLAAVSAIGKRFACRRATLPILETVKVTTDYPNSRLAFWATDLDVSVAGSVQADIAEAGAACLDVKKLADAVKGCNCIVELTASDKHMIGIQSGNMLAQFAGLDPEEHVSNPVFRADVSMDIPQPDLAGLLGTVEHAQSTDETRYVLIGVYMERKGGKLTLVATDGRRLCYSIGNAYDGDDFAAIIPTYTVEKLLALLGDTGNVNIAIEREGKGELGAESKLIRFTFDAIVGKGKRAVSVPLAITSRVVAGMFPRWQQVIPVEHLVTVTVNPADILPTLANLGKVAGKCNQACKVHAENNAIVLTVHDDDGKPTACTVPAVYTDKPITIAVNPLYFADAVRAIGGDAVEVRLTDELTPLVFAASGKDTLCVVMPMRLK
jgi:DNA polymerase-3 subunit beta